MNRSQIRDLVIANTNRSDKTDQINTWIDLAIQEIRQVYDFRAQRTEVDLVLGTSLSRVSLPTDVFQLIGPVRLLDAAEGPISYEVSLYEKSFVEHRVPNLQKHISKFPECCFIDWQTNEIVFVPPTSQQWTVRLSYWKLPGVIGDADAVQRGVETCIEAWVTARVFKSIQMFAEANQWLQEYERTLRVAVLADQRTGSVRTMQPFEACPRKRTYWPPDSVRLPDDGATY